MVVITGIGSWVSAAPEVFLVDQYLKYLAWALSDRSAAVRSAAVTALVRLYSDK